MLPKTRAALQKNIRKEATSLPVALEAETKTRTRQLTLDAHGTALNAEQLAEIANQDIATGNLGALDFANLSALGRISGQLKNTYLESISAAKITSATMLATTLTLAGTDASNNKTSLVMIGDALMRVNDGTADRLRLSNAGMEIGNSDEGISPTVVAGRGIFNIGSKHSGITIFNNPARRGWSIRADGTGAGAPNGHLFLIATRTANSEATQTSNWASLEAQVDHSGTGVIANRAGVIVRNMLWSAGPARIGGDMDVVGALNANGTLNANSTLDANGATYLNAGIARRDAGNLQFNRGLDVNVGDIRLTAASAQGIRSVGGTPLDLYAPTASIRAFNALRAEAGLIVTGAANVSGTITVGGISMPANSIGQAELAASTDTDTARAVHIHHIKDSLRNPAQGSLGLRTIGTFWGGTSVAAASNNHGHSVSYKELPKDKREKIAASREKLHASLIPKSQMEALPVAELAKRVWLQERQMAAVLHMLADDPERPASVREADIVAGTETDNSISRYEEFTQTYEELHPTATQLFDSFTLEEMSA